MKRLARGATRVYSTGVKTVGKTANAFMKPVTKGVKKIVRKAPLIGRPAALAVSVPRRVTRAAVAAGLALPRAAGTIAGTGFKVVKHAMLDPVLAMGVGSPLVALGLSPSGRPKRITGKKSAKKSRGKK